MEADVKMCEYEGMYK